MSRKYTDEFYTKQEFIDFVKNQINIDLTPDPNDKYISAKNDITHVLYTKIPKHQEIKLLSFLNLMGRRYEEHLDDYYWIWISDNDKN